MASEKARVAYLRYGKNTPYARRRRHYRLMRTIAEELQLGVVADGRRAALSRAATLQMLIEDSERALIGGAIVDVDNTIKLASELRRTVGKLRTNVPKDDGETLADIIAEMQGAK